MTDDVVEEILERESQRQVVDEYHQEMKDRFDAWKRHVAQTTDIDDALAALKADGFNHDDALRALDVLVVYGFLITRPQTLLDQLANAALETRP